MRKAAHFRFLTARTWVLVFNDSFDTSTAKHFSATSSNSWFPSYMFALLTEVVFRNLVNKLTLIAYRFARGSHD